MRIRERTPLHHPKGDGSRRGTRRQAELRASGIASITLDTTAVLEPALRLYERHGYRHSGRMSDYFGIPLFEYVELLGDV